MIKPYQFVGYWGCGNSKELENILTKLLDTTRNKRFNQQFDYCCWGVGYIGLDKRDIDFSSLPSQGSNRFGLSAAGLHDAPEAWVEVENNCLILGREAFGRVPLYWMSQEGIIWFASRLRLLLPLVKNPQFSIPAVYGYSCFSYVPTPLTPVENILAVPAGKEIVWYLKQNQIPPNPPYQGGKLEITPNPPYQGGKLEITPNQGGEVKITPNHGGKSEITPNHGGKLEITPNHGGKLEITSDYGGKLEITNLHEWREAPVLLENEGNAIAQLQILLQNAIHRQIADLNSEPVGVFLSGGIDSSTVAALLVQAGVKVRAYALDFTPILGDSRFSEFPYAQKVAEYLNIPLVKVEVTPQKIRNAISLTAEALDLPFGDGATIPLFLLSQVASQETSVIFNGENGDQLFAGWTNKPLIAAGIYNQENPGVAKEFNRQYLDTFGALSGYEKSCFQPDVYSQIKSINPQDWLEEALNPAFSAHLLARLRRATLMLKGAQNIQPRANNIGLSQGLWVRSPFCDLQLTEWAFQLPGDFCLRGVCEKYILKKAVESWLPSEVVWREKQGMAIPVTALCLNALRNEVKTWLSPSKLKGQGIWQPSFPYQVLSGNMGGNIRKGKIGRILWLMMMWQAWASTVLGESYEAIAHTNQVGNLLYDLFYFPPFDLKNKIL